MSPATSTRKRLDQAMFDNNLAESREKAKRLIMAGKVRINDQLARKPSDQVKPEDRIEVPMIRSGDQLFESSMDDAIKLLNENISSVNLVKDTLFHQ